MIVESTTVHETACACCGTVRTTVTAHVSEHGAARAAVFVYCYPPHGDEPSEIWIDAILGTWGADDHRDHVTFGCRYGSVPDQVEHACSLTDAATQSGPDPMFGYRLTRRQALRHDKLAQFWRVVDLVMTTVPEIGEHRARYHQDR